MKREITLFTNFFFALLFLSMFFDVPFPTHSAFAEDSEEAQITTPQRRVPGRRRRPGAAVDSGRRREGREIAPNPTVKKTPRTKPGGVYREPGIAAGPEFFPVTNRWDLLYQGKWWDPYNQNQYKGDLPIFGTPGNEWFLEVLLESDSLYEARAVPTPVAITSTRAAGRNDIFGGSDQQFFNQNLVMQFSLIKGNTTFKPQDIEIRIAPIVNFNHVNVEENGVLRINPSRGSSRDDAHISLFAAFIDIHLLDLNHRYDFVSFRGGVQEFNADFRGFLFNEIQPGLRFFGNYDNNKWQWNAAYFRRLKLDANALLPILFEDRSEDVLIFNTYAQDLLALGHTVEFLLAYRDDRFGDEGQNFDENGFLTSPPAIGDERAKNLNTLYFGVNSEGHFDRWNVSSTFYWALGEEDHNPIAGQKTDINAFFLALELSYDIDWLRPKTSFLFASGDSDPFDGDAEGFDAILENPNFAGGEFSYWNRQGIPFIGGGGVALTNRLSPLANLRPGKEQGQSNFVNPGVFIWNLGLDIDVTPKTIVETNVNFLSFADTSSLEAVRSDGSIDKNIGIDISTGVRYRPLLSNNIQIGAGGAVLIPGDGLKNLYGDETLWHFFTNVILEY